MQTFRKIFPALSLLLGLMMLGGWMSVQLGQDVNWDLFNYHLYNPFAFLHGKIGSDVMAAGVHSCLNPLLDVYFYFAFMHFFDYPRVIAFWMGMPYGILVWVGYYLSKEIFSKTQYPRWFAAGAAAIGATAAGVLSQVGTTTNEIFCAIFILSGFYLVVRFLRDFTKKYLIYGAAFLLGLVAGLKLTSMPFCLALAAAVFVHFKKISHPWRTLGLFACCGCVGFFVTNGYFMWKWWTLYHNPIFPYYNNIFHSPYFDPVHVTETRFYPKSILQWIFYPFYWALAQTRLVTEANMQDMRLSLAWLGAFIWGWRIIKDRLSGISRHVAVSLLAFVGVGYVLWLVEFSILRYAATLEMLSGVLIVGVCAFYLKGRWQIYAIGLLLGLLAVGYTVPEWRHQDFQEKTVVFENKPTVEDDALVFFMHLPSSYLAPLLNPKAAYMGGFVSRPEEYPEEYRLQAAKRNNLQPQYYGFHFEDLQRAQIKAHQGPIYIISIDWPMIVNPATLARFGLEGRKEDCQAFTTQVTIYSPKLAICRVQKKEGK